MEGKRTSTILTLALGFSILLSVFCFGSQTDAASASLYLSPSTGNYTVGNTFLVQVKLNSGGVAVNAADGTLVFNPDKLEVTKVTKTNSIFTFWVQEPTFSNSVGTINFAGGIPSPGFTGVSGLVINITFKAKTSNTASLTFAAGSILADDGKGTNILASMGGGAYKLTTKEITPLPPIEGEEEYVPPVSEEEVSAISSPTHPSGNQWYSNNAPEFTWKLPSDVTAVRLLMDNKSFGIPNVVYLLPISEKKLEDLTDGIWYFHAQFKDQYGWGDIFHRRVLIDTESPESFEVTVDNEGDFTNPAPTLYFESQDTPSGIDYYEVKIDDEVIATTTAPATKEKPYRLLPQIPGEYTVEIRALDEAGNFSSATSEFEIFPIVAPQITKIPISIRMGEVLRVEGKGLPDLTVRIYIQKVEKEPIFEKVKPDSAGEFVLAYEKSLEKGDYLVWARSEDEREALSYPTKKYSLEVGLPPLLKFGKITIEYLTTMINLIILLIGAAAIIFYIWHRVSIWRKRVRREAREVGESVKKSFRALQKEINEQIEFLDKKPGLTKAEKQVRDRLRKALNVFEESISKEVKDVEKELD